MDYPNIETWHALKAGECLVEGKKRTLEVIDAGTLKVTSGKVRAEDPFIMEGGDRPYYKTPIGEFNVHVTVADVSEEQDGSHKREAYASLLFSPATEEVTRKMLHASLNDDNAVNMAELASGQIYGFGVDTGTAAFVDADAFTKWMPPEEDGGWYETLFDNGKADSWFGLMDRKDHVREGIANIKLPLAKNNSNLILFHSGWGDGFYPVIGGYSEKGELIALHIDFFVISTPKSEESDDIPSLEVGEPLQSKPWWKFW